MDISVMPIKSNYCKTLIFHVRVIDANLTDFDE